jgi:hypothetical protein
VANKSGIVGSLRCRAAFRYVKSGSGPLSVENEWNLAFASCWTPPELHDDFISYHAATCIYSAQRVIKVPEFMSARIVPCLGCASNISAVYALVNVIADLSS